MGQNGRFDHFGPFCPRAKWWPSPFWTRLGVQIGIWAHFCPRKEGPEVILDPFGGPNWDLEPFCLAKWGSPDPQIPESGPKLAQMANFGVFFPV